MPNLIIHAGEINAYTCGELIYFFEYACGLSGYLLDDPTPDGADKDFMSCMNPNSLEVVTGCKVEASLAEAAAPAGFRRGGLQEEHVRPAGQARL